MIDLSRQTTSKTSGICRCTVVLAFAATLLASGMTSLSAEAQGNRHAVLIGGLGGTPEHTSRFEQFLAESRRGLLEQFGFAEENVFVLGETAISDRPFVRAVSTSDNIRKMFEDLKETVAPDDDVYVILFGHGSYDGTNAQLNIPRRDLDDADYDALLAALPAKRIVFLNTASSSGPFVAALSAPGRIIVTATRTGTERNETAFPRFVVEALSSGSADLDRNGSISVAEIFQFASERTTRFYDDAGNLATEHSLLDDNGDGKGSELTKMDQTGDGALASVTQLRSKSGSLAISGRVASAEVSQLLSRKERLEIEIAELKSRKSDLDEDEYYASLETLFVSLARLNNVIEQ